MTAPDEADELYLSLYALPQFVQDLGVEEAPFHDAPGGQFLEQFDVVFQVGQKCVAHVGLGLAEDDARDFGHFVFGEKAGLGFVDGKSLLFHYIYNVFKNDGRGFGAGAVRGCL